MRASYFWSFVLLLIACAGIASANIPAKDKDPPWSSMLQKLLPQGFTPFWHKAAKSAGGLNFTVEVESKDCLKEFTADQVNSKFARATFTLAKASKFRVNVVNPEKGKYTFKIKILLVEGDKILDIYEPPLELEPGYGFKYEMPKKMAAGVTINVIMMPVLEEKFKPGPKKD